MNSADPRVDSDRDGSRNMGAATHSGTTGAGYGAGHTGTTGAGYGAGHTGTTGAGYGSSTTGTTGAGYGNDPRSTNAGPHSSNLMNSADPRVDSDRDGSRNMGAASNTGYGSSTAGTHGTHGTTGTHGGIGSTGTHGTHGGVGSTGVGSTGVGHSTHGTGVSATPGSGNTNKTAGPHNSDMLNNLTLELTATWMVPRPMAATRLIVKLKAMSAWINKGTGGQGLDCITETIA